MSERAFDLVLFGATGFTGRLVAEYLVEHAATAKGAEGGPLRWALAGRDARKLEDVRRAIGAADLPVLTADATDPNALGALAGKARVVCTTVGPYAQYGKWLVGACAENGTDYCELTGEVQFVRAMIDAHHARAEQTAARIVHCCGFDSIPSDLGVLLLAEHFRSQGHALRRAKFVLGRMSGGMSGGTTASMLNIMDEASHDRELRRLLADPYALMPDRVRDRGPDGPDAMGVAYDDDAAAWTAPFVMAAINTRIVRRSNALLGYPYGRDFRYEEVTGFPGTPRGLAMATGMTAGIGGFMALAVTAPTRKLLGRVLPKPGDGPSKETRERGYFEVRILGWGDGDARPSAEALVEGRADPGYGETAKMLGETALELVETHRARARGGVLTPASALGMPLVDRLRRAHMRFDVRAR